MTDEELYTFSKSLGIFKHMNQKLKELHIHRYSRIVDFSDQKHKCRLAISTKESLGEEHDEFFLFLNDIREIADLYEEKYKREILNDKKEREE